MGLVSHLRPLFSTKSWGEAKIRAEEMPTLSAQGTVPLGSGPSRDGGVASQWSWTLLTFKAAGEERCPACLKNCKPPQCPVLQAGAAGIGSAAPPQGDGFAHCSLSSYQHVLAIQQIFAFPSW